LIGKALLQQALVEILKKKHTTLNRILTWSGFFMPSKTQSTFYRHNYSTNLKNFYGIKTHRMFASDLRLVDWFTRLLLPPQRDKHKQ